MFKSKHPKLILNEIKWRFDLDKCEVYYIHRGAPGDTKIIKGSDIRTIDRSFLILEGDVHEVYIPYHRIFRIDYEGRTVFIRKKRNLIQSLQIDTILPQTPPPTSLISRG